MSDFPSTNLRTGGCTSGGTSGTANSLVSGYLSVVAESSVFTSSSRISPRATSILTILSQLRLMSAKQIHRMAFADGSFESSGRRMRRTMARLTELNLVKRLPRPVGGWSGGSDGYFYQPIDGGLRSLPPHTMQLTEIFVQLIEAEQRGELQILQFDSEPNCHQQVGHVELKPDAYVRIRTPQGTFRWWLEVDLDSEKRTQLKRKCVGYCKAYEKWPTIHPDGPDKAFPRILWAVTKPSRYEALAGIIKNQEYPQIFGVALFSDAIDRIKGE